MLLPGAVDKGAALGFLSQYPGTYQPKISYAMSATDRVCRALWYPIILRAPTRCPDVSAYAARYAIPGAEFGYAGTRRRGDTNASA
eukprot:1218897-Rhodomonas_salina.2